MDNRVAIVGGGYAGMAAGVALAERGVPATVFESGPVPGGRARRVRISIDGQGRELDNGQHIFVGAYTELFRLMRTVGVPSEALLRYPLEVRYAGSFSLRSRWFPAPLGLLAGLLFARGVSFRERLGALRFMATLRRIGFRVEPDISVRQFLDQHGQHGRMRHYLWAPLCVSALNTPLEQASTNAFLAALRDTVGSGGEASDFLLPRVDLSRLFPEPAAEFIRSRGGEVRCGTTVRDLASLQSAFTRIIVAVGPHQLKTLLPEAAADFTYQPIYTCYLQYPESTHLPFPMLGMSDGLVQWVFDRGALLGEQGRLACVISAQGDHQQMTHDEVADRCHRELLNARLAHEKPAWSQVIAEKRATISCTPGLARPDVKREGVILAGDYTDSEYPPTLEAAVRSGVRAARMILQET
ncbi:MAG TPA: hydroxysqualene dehydroxylase HpnE [Burkholderiales bacterium]|nr:hydroxysqualene dehydroxylase HpnE [Burkholderiales bacterium]